MKNNIFIYIITGVVVMGGVFFALKGNPGQDSKVQEEGQVEQVQEEGGAISGSMKDLVALNKPLECTFTSNTEYSKTKGTVYVADGKVRGNFSVSVVALGDKSFDAFMIADKTDSYVWSSLMNDGFKTKIEQQPANTSQQEGINYNQTLSYTCIPWNADSSFFIPPQDITFKDAIKQ